MKSFAGMLLFCGVLAAGWAHARGTVPIVDRTDVPYATGSGKPVTAEAFGKAVVNGASAIKWEVTPAGDGKGFRATYRVRNKHVIVVDIVPGQEAFSVKYADSANMNYGVEGGARVIHPNYVKWVDGLVDSIRTELKKF